MLFMVFIVRRLLEIPTNDLFLQWKVAQKLELLDNNRVSVFTTRKHAVNLQLPTRHQRCGVKGTLAGLS